MKKMIQTLFEWKQTGDDPNDLIATDGENTLRVEQMDRNWFWWAVYIGKNDYHCWDYGKAGTSLEDAKQRAEKKYLELINK